MREHLFRGKTENYGKWVEGGYIEWTNSWGLRAHQIVEKTVGIFHKIDPTTLGQYTGRTDNENGVKIFEGDIVADMQGNIIGEVYWAEHIYQWRIGNTTHTESMSLHAPIYLNVIGNIHDKAITNETE